MYKIQLLHYTDVTDASNINAGITVVLEGGSLKENNLKLPIEAAKFRNWDLPVTGFTVSLKNKSVYLTENS